MSFKETLIINFLKKKKIIKFYKLINWNILIVNNKKSNWVLFSSGEWKININFYSK